MGIDISFLYKERYFNLFIINFDIYDDFLIRNIYISMVRKKSYNIDFITCIFRFKYYIPSENY